MHYFKSRILSLLFFVFTLYSYGQSTDLFRVASTYIPENDNGVETVRYRFLVNVPIKLKNERFFVTGAEFNRFDFTTAPEFSFDTSPLDQFYVLDLNLGYITNWNKDWKFIGLFTPRLASNFTDRIASDDIRINASAALLKDVPNIDKAYRLAIGLAFNSNAGLPFPLPCLLYTSPSPRDRG